VNQISEEPVALDEEVGFILRNAGKYLIRQPGRKDILSVFAGLRPLASDPDNPDATREISRRHKITLSTSGLLSVYGGKWTFYRRMAEETIDKAARAGMLESRPCGTSNLCLVPVPETVKNTRFLVYGKGAAEIENLIAGNPGNGKKLHPAFDYTVAEITWICKNEMPVNLEDMMARRTRALFLHAAASMELAPAVAAIMAEQSGWDANTTEEQIASYRTLAQNYLAHW